MSNMSRRLGRNSVNSVESLVISCIPKWLSYPRCLRMVYGSLYRFGSLVECIDSLCGESPQFESDWNRYVTKQQLKDVEKFADAWYARGELPSSSLGGLTFTFINQQLFYESTLRGNASLYGNATTSASDVKLAIEGGFGNHVEMERVRNNASRKAVADRDIKRLVANMDFADTENEGDVFGSTEVEYIVAETENNDESGS